MGWAGTERAADIVIVGGGLAGAAAVEELRKRDRSSTIALVTADTALPYHRPPLSKEYLRAEIDSPGVYGAGGIFVHPENWYDANRIYVERGSEATVLDVASRTLVLANGLTYRYEKLLLTTGGRARRLHVPGSNLRGVYTLRSLDDATAIRTELSTPGKRVVVIGTRFVGLESAASAILSGAEVTLVDPTPHLWQDMMPSMLSDYFHHQFTARGATFMLGYGPIEIIAGRDGRVAAVRVVPTQGDGPAEDIPCDMVIVGIGIELNTEIAARAGLRLDSRRAVIVNDLMQTSAPEVFAAGDIITYPDIITGWMHFEHWDHALASGQAAAINMSGSVEIYRHVPYFFSDQFDLAINMLGYPSSDARVVVRGSLAANAFTALYVRHNRLLAAMMVNDANQLVLLRDLIASGAPVHGDVPRLGDPNFDLANLMPHRAPLTRPQW